MGNPPLSLMGCAFTKVTVSKQVVKDTPGNGRSLMVMDGEVAGFVVTHARFEVRMQDTRSPDTGLYEKVALLALPALMPLTFH
jgi:hypothetical protein